MKTVTFTIEPFGKSLKRFSETYAAVAARRRTEPKDLVGFTSLEAARNFLTRERLGLLRAIKAHRPGSIYELAQQVQRDLKNVQDDIKILERHGLVRITKRPRGTRKVKVPQVPFGEIALRIAI
jgi:predicted transcriptional regulator